MSSIVALAETPGRIEKLFLNQGNQLSPNGIYAVNFYSLGLPHTVIIDDWLPLTNAITGKPTTMFANVGEDGSLWAPLLEKAFAKYHGNYSHIQGGDSRTAAKTLSGAPSFSVEHMPKTLETHWDTLVKHLADGNIATVVTNSKKSDKHKMKNGLFYNHVYTVLETYVSKYGDKLIKMRNPHGEDSYTGDWSDNDFNWTTLSRKEQAKYNIKANDGIFWIDHKNFFDSFKFTFFTFDNTNWSNAYFLKLNDDSAEKNPAKYQGTLPWCGANCTRHILTLKSSVTQTVYLTAHTWDERGKAKSCGEDEEYYHTI